MIRLANKFDNEQIKEFLKDYHREYGNALSHQIDKWSSNYVDDQLAKIYAGLGFVLIEDDGFLCAMRAPCFWIPNVYVLQETMWYAKSKKTSVMLIKKYIEDNEIPLYINSTPNGIFVFDLREINPIWITDNKMPKTTEFNITAVIEKTYSLININKGKKI
jgi:hypothetical protein